MTDLEWNFINACPHKRMYLRFTMNIFITGMWAYWKDAFMSSTKNSINSVIQVQSKSIHTTDPFYRHGHATAQWTNKYYLISEAN